MPPSKRQRATKIVATIGPASRSVEVLGKMIDAGLNLVRMNFSHGSKEDHRQTCEMVRDLADRRGVSVGILQDLQGPKIRVGRFAQSPVVLEQGQTFVITAEDVVGDQHRVSTTYTLLPQDVRPGMQLLLDDGNLQLEVIRINGQDIVTRVVIGGPLSNNKGINIPEADLSIPALSEKDLEDLVFGAELGVDWVALSFVRSREDLVLAKQHLQSCHSTAKLMAKIEKPSAVDRFQEILEEADGIMVARGDLGVEMPPEQVPSIQKILIRSCREAGKPVITATKMLESMIHLPRPTRAEASDVANAIYDGTDAVMLSAESASGMYPVEAVGMMDRIARVTESTELYRQMVENTPSERNATQDSIALAACEVGEYLEAPLIVCFTDSGSTALRVSRYRPHRTILALTPNRAVRDQLVLSSGVLSFLAPDPRDTEDMVVIANEEIKKHGLAVPGDRYVIAAGVPFGKKGTTNMVRVERVR